MAKTICLICRKNLGTALQCKACSEQLTKLINQGRVPRGVDFYNWELMVDKMREMRRKGCPESEVRETMQKRCDQLHQIWLDQQNHTTIQYACRPEDIEKELPF